MPDLFEAQTVHLRPFEPADLPALHAYLNHPDLVGRRYIPWGLPDDLPLTRAQAESILQRWSDEKEAVHLAVVAKDSQEIIGHVEWDLGWDHFSPSIALVIGPNSQRQGYGSEALQLALAYLFGNTMAHNVSCWVADWNTAGREFLKKHGFSESGRVRRAGWYRGSFYDWVVIDQLRPEWAAVERGGQHGA